MPQGETSTCTGRCPPQPPLCGLRPGQSFQQSDKVFPGDTGTVGISGPQSGGKLQGKGALGSSLARPHTALCAGLSSWAPHHKPSSLCPPVSVRSQGYARQLHVGSSSSSTHPQTAPLRPSNRRGNAGLARDQGQEQQDQTPSPKPPDRRPGRFINLSVLSVTCNVGIIRRAPSSPGYCYASKYLLRV